MSESKHTPGPWRVDESGKTVSSDAVTDIAILNMANPRYGWGGSDVSGASYRAANARLIAAAPELLESLILMVRTHDEPAESMLQEMREQKWLEQARAAIAKATGSIEATE
jgi:hypothetical protein